MEYSSKAIHGYSSILVLRPPIIRSELPAPHLPLPVPDGSGSKLFDPNLDGCCCPQQTTGLPLSNPHWLRFRYALLAGVNGGVEKILYRLAHDWRYMQSPGTPSGVVHGPKLS